MARDRNFQIALSDDEHARIHEAAEMLGIRAAIWARGVLLRQADRALAGLDENLAVPPVLDPVDEIESSIRSKLAETPRKSDTQVAAALGLHVDRVRRLRTRLGIAPGRSRAQWQKQLRDAWEPGLGAAEVAQRTGWTIRTVQQRASQLGLSLRKTTK